MDQEHRPIYATLGVFKHCVNCIVGIHPEERVNLQELWFDIQVEKDVSTAIQTKSLIHTIDYTRLAEICTEIAVSKQYELLESIAHDIIKQIFCEFDVNWVWVKIKKPSAIPSGEYAFIEIKEYKWSKA